MTAIRERFNKLLFNRVVGGVLRTPPLRRGGREFTALSMVHHRDVVPYLLAIKSFATHTQPTRVIVVADPTLDAADRSLLGLHVPHLEIIEAARFRRPALPVGGCWERLSAISALNAETAIVQVDADTLTTGPLDEVLAGVGKGASFVLRSEAGIEITTLDQAAVHGRTLLAGSRHIQALTESQMDRLPASQHYRYARGCAGFTGFGRGAIDSRRLDDVSAAMRSLHGARWDDWGSEQVTSNLLAASAPNAFMLPHPAYCNADSRSAETRLTHYIGYARFTTRSYETQAARVIGELAAAA